jgi:hypothetical protein
MLTVAARWWVIDVALAPGKGDEAKTQAPSKQAQRSANSKAGQLVDWVLPHLTAGEADQAAATENRRKKKHYP